jgi:glycosyltransferase involved in cell wall biosynthesis
VKAEYGRDSVVIRYGAAIISPGSNRIDELSLVRQRYHLLVARFEPENHVLEAVAAYRSSAETRPLVVVGSAPYSHGYVEQVRAAAQEDPRIMFTGGIYDQELLDQLYANARTYIHGHSVGGTNPSLLRAMGAGAPVLAYDVEFNREVTDGQALFWATEPELTALFDASVGDGLDEPFAEFTTNGLVRIAAVYQWDSVTDEYESLIQGLAARSHRGASHS